MNMSETITRMKLQLFGMLNIVTPFEDLNGTIKSIIEDITLPVFSIYSPSKDKISLCLNDLEMVRKGAESCEYLLPDFKTRELLYVLDLNYSDNDTTSLAYFAGTAPFMNGPSIRQLMLGNVATQIANYFVPSPTMHFTPPRKLEVFNAYASAHMRIELGFQHDKSLASIPRSASESFMELAMLDQKMTLYPTLKYYADNDTAYGHIGLKIEGWESAESDRKQLLDKWDDTYHLDVAKPFYWL